MKKRHAIYSIAQKVQILFAAIEEVEKQEVGTHGGRDLHELGQSSAIISEKLKHAVKQLEVRLQEKPKDKPLKKAVRTLRKDLLPNLHKYKMQEAILGTRKGINSRNIIRRHMPSNIDVGRGFILTKKGCSTQIDILLTYNTYPVLFREGD
uniref:DUF6602 domain-containing protein n=2 Tax=Paenibacillus sedimenti TaxID=2770274 RepID=UPI0035E3E801